MINLIKKSVFAGLLISLEGVVYLKCPDKTVGAFLFSFGLLGVFLLEANLYTGKVGYINSKRSVFDLMIILGVNLVTAFLVGLIYGFISDTPITAFQSRMDKSWLQLLIDSFICGVLIYIAVEFWKSGKQVLPVILCVMAFILGGAEHSIADMFFLSATKDFSVEAFGRVGLIVIGNGIGSISIRLLQKGWKM